MKTYNDGSDELTVLSDVPVLWTSSSITSFRIGGYEVITGASFFV